MVKNVFLQSLIVTVAVFLIGLMLGFAIENNRVNYVNLALINSEIDLLDEQIRGSNIDTFQVDCATAVSSTFEFADRIYQEAKLLEEYDSSNKFTPELKIIHKRYDLLRMLLWSHGIEVREKCNADFHTVVYLFDYNSESLDIRAKQISMERITTDLKEKYGNLILLIPIADNLDLKSVETVKKKFGITQGPALVIDEKKLLTEDLTLPELETIIFEKTSN